MMASTPGLPATEFSLLLISELFEQILDQFCLSELGAAQSLYDKKPSRALQEARQALAALAQTCRALSEPSLNYLWKRLDSLEPLIRSFAPIADEDRAKAALSPAEWNTITRYSHRVRELAATSEIDRLFLGSAASTSQSPFLFPNLQVLRWSEIPVLDSDLELIMDRLLSPSLVTLSAAILRTDSIDTFLENCIRLGPRWKLRSARFDISQAVYFIMPVETEEIHLLSQAISIHVPHLESLELSVPIDDVALTPIIMSPELKNTCLVIHPTKSNLDNVCIASADIPFRNVKELELRAWNLSFISSLLRPQGQIFHTFRLRLIGVHDPKAIFAFFDSLASPQRRDTLRHFNVTYRNSFALPLEIIDAPLYEHSEHRLTYDTLLPLASFRHLREFVLFLYNHIFITDEELTNLIRNWPMLEVLVFKCSYGCFGTPITLNGLLSVLALCPRLKALSLSLDAREVPLAANEEAPVRNTHITSIGLPDSPIYDACLVAAFISKHLPSVANISVGFHPTRGPAYEPPRQYEKLWEKVNEYLKKE